MASSFETGRPGSPSNSDVLSMKSDQSMGKPINFNTEETRGRPGSPSNSDVLSMKSDQSMGKPINFNTEETRGRPGSPSNSDVLSMRSDQSMGKPINFNTEETRGRPGSPSNSDVSMKRDQSMGNPTNFNTAETSQGTDSPLNNDVSSSGSSGNSTNSGNKDSRIKVLKEPLKKRILKKHKTDGQKNLETELIHITAADVNNKEGKPLGNFGNLFKPLNDVRTVLTSGVARIGKTFNTQKMMVDWANGNSNKDIDLIVQFNLSQLESSKHKEQSLKDLLDDHFHDLKVSDVSNYEDYKIAFVLDEFEKHNLDLDFQKNNDLSDLDDKASVGVLLTSLIKGTLLHSARLWIISQTSDVKIPPNYIDKVTLCRETSTRQEQLMSDLKARFKNKPSVPKNLYPPNIEHVIREGSDYEAEKVSRVSNITEIFKENNTKKIRTVLTIEKPDIGKTFHVDKFIQEWAKAGTGSFFKRIPFLNKPQDKELIFPLKVSKLCELKNKTMSLDEVLQNVFEEMRKSVISNLEIFKIIIILDGLNSRGLPLDFNGADTVTDVRQKASVDVLLTNLIKGNLLPSAKLWITSDQSSLEWLPEDMFQRVTEIRGIKVLKEPLKKRILKKHEAECQKKSETELIHITAADVNNKEGKPLGNFGNLFKPLNDVRTVLTSGVARIGKTFNTQKMMVDWANGNSNKDIDLIVQFNLSQLESSKHKEQSLKDLLDDHFHDLKVSDVSNYEDYKIAFVLDEFEKHNLDLDFQKNNDLSDLDDKASVGVLLTSLIKGTLLHSARLWIISQTSDVKIPPNYIDKVTLCRETSTRQEQLMSDLKARFKNKPSVPKNLYPPNIEHVIREGSDYEAEKVSRVSNITEIFKENNTKKIRTVLTIEEPDIGKTFHVDKFIQEWAKAGTGSFFRWIPFLNKSQDKELIFPLKVSKLCELKNKTMSLDEVLQNVFEEMKKSVISNLEIFKIIIILDGLNSRGLPLDFNGADTVTDVRQKATVDVLLTNLIKGNLLPSAKLWITSDQSSLEWLPEDMFQRVTEIREKPDVASQRNLKNQLKKQFTFVSEGLDKQETSASLKSIYTDLYIIRGERGKVNVQHESRQIQEAKFKSGQEEIPIKCLHIFQPAPDESLPPRNVFTLGMAGIGKTFASMKFILDWADGTANKSINFIFPLSFRELNLIKEEEHSFQELIHRLFPAMKRSEITNYDQYQVLVVLDGLDECRLDLNFRESKHLTDVKQKTTVNVLLVNLIKGNLLPKAQVWITTRPAASNTIPAGVVHRVTEVRGFNDEQKEEYFKKRFNKEDLVNQILEHVRKSRSVHIMCHIPVFCWITAKVLEDFVQRNQEEGMPKTLTDMYICFLLLQCRQANIKYTKEETSDILGAESIWNERNKKTILSLAKVAFDELEKGNFLFTEDSLPKNIVEGKAAVFSGLLTQVKREGCEWITNFYCFVHLSIQEFLAALHVIQTFNNEGKNLLQMEAVDLSEPEFYKTAVDKTLASENGDRDLFLRFLLGLSVETNQTLLQDILKKTENSKEANLETIEYIKSKINEEMNDPEKNLNLFHCLNELNDHSLVQEVKKYLQSNTLPFESFSKAQWSALNFVLLMSDEKLDVFDLKKYLKSEKVFLGMLPVVKVSKTARLSWCELSEESCKGLNLSVLCSASSNLTKLDLSHNDLLDSGVEQLAEGLKSVHCKLKSLNLAGCQVTEKGCGYIASALEFRKAADLKMLDLSYNHPGDIESKRLQDITEDPQMKLKTLCLERCGPNRLRSGIKKYEVYLTFDEKTAHRKFAFENGRKVKTIDLSKKAARGTASVNKDMVRWTQVFCERPEMPNQGLTGLCYWEMEWTGQVAISLAYEKVGRDMSHFGSLICSKISWSLSCSHKNYTARHGNTSVTIETEPCPRIGVFLDYDNGLLSFYSVTPGQLSHIYTFNEKFTRPLFPGFSFKKGCVSLCDID